MELKTCTIAGCRPTRFKWKYKENNEGCQRLKQQIREQLIMLYGQGVRRFYIGGSLGVDLWAGEILLELKGQPEYGELELALVLHTQDMIGTGISVIGIGYPSCGSIAQRQSSSERKVRPQPSTSSGGISI